MLSDLLFKKQLTDMTLADINIYFSQEQIESNILEFKSFNSLDKSEFKNKENGVLRTVCAFLNSEGGIIIWGAPAGKTIENSDGSKHKVFQGELSPVDQNLQKDSFMSRIANNLSPSPNGILFHSINIEEGKWLYIIEVPKSIYPPHQFQNIYFMRMDGHSRAAPHHYIEALMKQVKIPDVVGFLDTQYQSLATRNHGVIPFVLSINNFSRYIVAFKISYTLILSYGDFFYKNEEITINQQGRVDSDVFAVESLHYNKPFVKDFFIVLPELWQRKEELSLTLIWYGDNSPIKFSQYSYEYFGSESSPTPQLKLIKKKENQFSFSQSDNLGLTEEERARLATQKLLAESGILLSKQKMFQNLDRYS
jgi:hypothetical protein